MGFQNPTKNIQNKSMPRNFWDRVFVVLIGNISNFIAASKKGDPSNRLYNADSRMIMHADLSATTD